MAATHINSPDDPDLAELCRELAARSTELDRNGRWPAEQLQLCGQYGVYEWFLDAQWGGQGWREEQVVRGYLALSSACLTTTFIITQRTGACRRIAGSQNQRLKERLLPGLARGELFATVGISHLTTSRRHLGRPVLTARATASGFRLDGMSPWVTGGAAADILVLAATLVENDEPTDRQLLVAVPAETPGLSVAQPLNLVGVNASRTGPVHLDGVEIASEWVIAGPRPDVMSSGIGASTGGHETSTLALGVAQAAIDYLADESTRRPQLQEPLQAFRREHESLRNDLLSVARHDAACSAEHSVRRTGNGNATESASNSSPPAATKESIRQRANSLVLRTTQAALAAAKGSGYVVGHPVGRWCREALFFLVWSCPQPVANANLCELAGIDD